MKRGFTDLWVHSSWLRDLLSKKGIYWLLFLLACSFQGYAQARAVSVIVKDYEGEALPGLSIQEMGINNGTLTCMNDINSTGLNG